jgi:hypothetical protein
VICRGGGLFVYTAGCQGRRASRLAAPTAMQASKARGARISGTILSLNHAIYRAAGIRRLLLPVCLVEECSLCHRNNLLRSHEWSPQAGVGRMALIAGTDLTPASKRAVSQGQRLSFHGLLKEQPGRCCDSKDGVGRRCPAPIVRQLFRERVYFFSPQALCRARFKAASL